MSTESLKMKIGKTDICRILAVPSLVMMFASLFGSLSYVFDALPQEFNGAARMAAAFTGVLTAVFNRKKERDPIYLIIAVAAASGIVIALQTGIMYVLDTALIALLVIAAEPAAFLLTVFSFFSCVTGAAIILACKGYIRNFIINGQNTFGYRSLAGLYMSLAFTVIALVLIIYIWTRKKETGKMVSKFIFSIILSALLVITSLKAQNLAAAVEAGEYRIYYSDTSLGMEVRMKGFDDYTVGMGEDEASFFEIVPDGDHYQIIFDSYGVAKTLCVIGGELVAGNYDQASSAYRWDINPVPMTPYFTVSNVETGLYISVSDDGIPVLVSHPEEGTDNLRIGSDNNEYYERLSQSDLPDNDIRLANITVSPETAYTGSAARPSEISVELNGSILQEGRDYRVSFWNNYLPGQAWADITGIGDYEGTVGAPFGIVYDDAMCDDPFYRNTADYVVRVYRMGYRRYPSIDEVRQMVQILVGSNRTPDSVIWEVYNNGGFDCSNAQFMEALYRLMLLRNGSRSELMNWIAVLDANETREDVINAISASPDYQNIWHNFGIGFR